MYSCMPGDDHQTGGVSSCVCCRPLMQSATRRINAGLSRRGFVAGMGASLAALGFVRRAGAQPEAAPPPIVFTNFRLFDGVSAELRAGLRLFIEGDRIKAIEAGDVGAPEGRFATSADRRSPSSRRSTTDSPAGPASIPAAR